MSVLALLSLVGAVLCEVAATMSLRMASTGRRSWWAGVAVGYALAFALLVGTLAEGVPLGVAYGIWAAAGVALTAVLSRVFFAEPLTWVMGVGIALIMGGVLLIEIGATR